MPEEILPTIGRHSVELDAYGGDFSSPTIFDCFDRDEGLKWNPVIGESKQMAADGPGVQNFASWVDELVVEFRIEDHSATNFAYMFGLSPADIVDDSVSNPKTKTINTGNRISATEYALQVKVPQRIDPALFMIYRFTRVIPVAMGPPDQTMELSWVSLKFMTLRDKNNQGRVWTRIKEYA